MLDVSTSANRHRIGCVVRLRARARWQARWRPHPRMVCLGAVLFAVVSLHCFGGVGDLGRVDAQVVTGIGFLGRALLSTSRAVFIV